MQPIIQSLKKKEEVIETHMCADPSTGLCSPLPQLWQRLQWADRLCWMRVGDALLDDRSKQLPFYFAI